MYRPYHPHARSGEERWVSMWKAGNLINLCTFGIMSMPMTIGVLHCIHAYFAIWQICDKCDEGLFSVLPEQFSLRCKASKWPDLVFQLPYTRSPRSALAWHGSPDRNRFRKRTTSHPWRVRSSRTNWEQLLQADDIETPFDRQMTASDDSHKKSCMMTLPSMMFTSVSFQLTRCF